MAVFLAMMLGTGAWLLAPNVANQIDQLMERLPRSVQRLEDRLERYQWRRQLLERKPRAEELMPDRADAFAKATGVFSTAFGMIANFIIVLFVGLHLAAEPATYISGIVRLFPSERRRRVQEILDAIGYTLRWWLLGKAISMTVVGAFTAAGLWLLDMPLALTLGLLAALLAFIPNIGPILSFLPAALLALM